MTITSNPCMRRRSSLPSKLRKRMVRNQVSRKEGRVQEPENRERNRNVHEVVARAQKGLSCCALFSDAASGLLRYGAAGPASETGENCRRAGCRRVQGVCAYRRLESIGSPE